MAAAEGMCALVSADRLRSWAATGGSATTDFIIVIGLFAVAAAIWFIQIGGDEGFSDALMYVGRRVRALSQMGP